jgi:hypothetical protein
MEDMTVPVKFLCDWLLLTSARTHLLRSHHDPLLMRASHTFIHRNT